MTDAQLNIFDTPAGPEAVLDWFAHQGSLREATVRVLAVACGMTVSEMAQIVQRLVREGRLEEVQGPWIAADARYRVTEEQKGDE